MTSKDRVKSDPGYPIKPGNETEAEVDQRLFELSLVLSTGEPSAHDEERREISRLATIKHWDNVVRRHKEDPGAVPDKCNCYTSSPCHWSGTHWNEDKCDVCKREFATWN